MAYQVSWFVPGQVIQVVLAEQVTLEESRAFNEQIASTMDEAANTLHVLFDFRAASKVPLNPSEVAKTQTFLQHPQCGKSAVIGSQGIIRYITSMLHRTLGVEFKHVADEHAALVYFGLSAGAGSEI